ncbi:MAG TPA: protein kinase [Archangium sp.]|jgi:serine/threonine-protein kinase|uniref:serine/threonine protein kinase n=1 Tax=Archangium sp. TaxID=1872627 RepID=UPI002ED78E24
MRQVHYQPLGPLLSGEGSRAFLALALENGAPPRPVVLVWAPPEVARDPTQVARLQRETARAVVFEHPNILRVHGLAALDNQLARVTEFADGEPLRRILEASPRLPPPLAALVAADVAMGVHYAHVAGTDDGTPLVHGDLRPETVMVSFNGVCKVTGYGALGVAPREGNGRRVRNRRLYIAPEQLMGGREASSVLTDVFLLGLLLYECLSGRKPFQDSLEPDKAILSRPLPPLPTEIPLALNEVVRRATSKRSGERYPSALAFREALVAVVGELPTHAAFAEFLTTLIPSDSEARTARRKMIEKGIEAVTRHAPSRSPTPIGVPLVRAPDPVVVPPAAPVPPVPVAVAPARPSRSPVFLGVALGVLLIAGVVGALLGNRVEPALVVPEDAGVVATPAPVVEPPAPAPALEPLDAGVQVVSVPSKVDAGTPVAPPASVPTMMVELSVTPEADVSIAGRALGRTPLTVPLPYGRHTLTLVNAELGYRTARMIDVRPTGSGIFRIRLGMGSVLVLAPSGSQLTLDGREIGPAPRSELSIPEGEHELLVTLNGAVWRKSLWVPGDKRMVLNVDFEEQPTSTAQDTP